MAFSIKRHDLRPRYRVRLDHTDPDTGAKVPANLTGASSVKFLAVAGQTVVTGPAEFVDRATGVVEYAWEPGDTAIAGDYAVEFEVMWGTEPQTFPSDGYFTAKITQDLG